jgi:1,4-dihydroxy-2-naphthoyl-CoA hydrolase
MFETHTNVRLHDTDAAGLLFFGNYFRIAHAAYEDFMKSIGCGLDQIIKQSEYLLPIVHAEADYKEGLSLGDEMDVSLTAEVSKTSFVVFFTFTDSNGNVAAKLKTVHVSVDKDTRQKIPLPKEVIRGLATISPGVSS